MRSGQAVVAALACAVAGCAETAEGVLIHIDLGGGVDPAAVPLIDIWIGEPAPGGTVDEFIRSQHAQDVRAVDDWPYVVLVTPGDQPRAVWAGAFGYRDRVSADAGTAPSAAGTIPSPVIVERGVLREATLTLGRTADAVADCVFRPGAGGGPPLVIRPAVDGPLDCDDDGYLDPADCDDLDPSTNPGAVEICDARDNDCNAICDDRLDADGDGYSRCRYDDGCVIPAACVGDGAPASYVGACDCDDTDFDTNPGAAPAVACTGTGDRDCDGAADQPPNLNVDVPGNQIDEDCDGNCDGDGDGDGIADGPPGTWAATCDLAYNDCDDTDPETYPNALQRCETTNTDCSEQPTIVVGTCFVDTPGGCAMGTRTCNDSAVSPAWDPCVAVTAAGPIAGEVCSKWDQIADAAWPEQAAHGLAVGAGLPHETCELAAWRPSSGVARVNALCPQPRTVLRNRLPWAFDRCESVIAAALGNVAGWHLALRTRDLATPVTGARVPSCNVELVIVTAPGLTLAEVRLPSLWTAVIQQETRSDGSIQNPTIIPVEVVVRYADATTGYACPAQVRSLTCADELDP